MTINTGSHLRTPASALEVVVVTAPTTDGELCAAGAAMHADASAGQDPDGGTVLQMGKRYVHPDSGLEVLCVKPGAGPLTFSGEELTLKAAKPLPASD